MQLGSIRVVIENTRAKTVGSFGVVTRLDPSAKLKAATGPGAQLPWCGAAARIARTAATRIAATAGNITTDDVGAAHVCFLHDALVLHDIFLHDILLDDIFLHDDVAFLHDDVAGRRLSLLLADEIDFGVCRACEQHEDTDNAKSNPCELHVRYSPILRESFDTNGVVAINHDTNTGDQGYGGKRR